MISLNIEKTFGFISKESVSAYEAQVKPHRKRWKTALVKVTTFWGGCICPLLSVKSTWPT